MASNVTLKPSVETANYSRLCILLIDGGTPVLRSLLLRCLLRYVLQPRKKELKTLLVPGHISTLYPKQLPCLSKFDDALFQHVVKKCFPSIKRGNKSREELEKEIVNILKGETFEMFLKIKKSLETMKKKLDNKQIDERQYKVLYPDKQQVNVDDLDLSLISIVLLHLFYVRPTSGILDAMPPPDDTEVGDDVLRIRLYRNWMFHGYSASVSTPIFNEEWDDIAKTLIRISGEQLRSKINNLKTAPLDPVKEEQCRNLKFARYDKELELKKELEELTNRLSEIHLPTSKCIPGNVKENSYNTGIDHFTYMYMYILQQFYLHVYVYVYTTTILGD